MKRHSCVLSICNDLELGSSTMALTASVWTVQLQKFAENSSPLPAYSAHLCLNQLHRAHKKNAETAGPPPGCGGLPCGISGRSCTRLRSHALMGQNMVFRRICHQEAKQLLLCDPHQVSTRHTFVFEEVDGLLMNTPHVQACLMPFFLLLCFFFEKFGQSQGVHFAPNRRTKW